jgi:hypothetical protein
VVFVSVRQNKRGQIVGVFVQKIEIRNRNINAVRRFFGKSHSRVNDNHFVAVTNPIQFIPNSPMPPSGIISILFILDTILFPFADYWWLYAGFTFFVLLMLALDLGVFTARRTKFHLKKRARGASSGSVSRFFSTSFLYQYALWKFPQDERLLAIPGFNPDLAAWNVSGSNS